MKKIIFILSLSLSNLCFNQSINLNNASIYDEIRDKQLLNKVRINNSMMIRPINFNEQIDSLIGTDFNLTTNSFKLLPIDLISEFTSKVPYNRNNGILIPNKGFQQLISFGFFFELGPLSIQVNPEYLYAENKEYEGFWSGHYPYHISKRLQFWNDIDNPERFGKINYREFFSGQSSIKLNFNKISLGYSSENIWWGPSIRNSIMMSNNARGFEHITVNTIKPLNIGIGNFEFHLVTGKLVESGFEQSYSKFKYANHLTFLEKNDDWRYFQGINIIYSPKFIDGFSIGFIRWTQAYSKFIKENKDFFPVFDNLFRKNDKYGYQSGSLEGSRDQAAGLNFRWIWKNANAEIYGEYFHNDSKANIRDLLLDSDHSRAATIGLQKIFSLKNSDDYFKFSWEWTQMEQTAGRTLRNQGMWYHHSRVQHGFTNRGEVMGSSIGPGSNSHYFGILKSINKNKFGIYFEIVDQNNDFLYHAFGEAKDFRRYWKDYNFHFSFKKKLNHYWIDFNAMYSKNLNYQWGLDESKQGEGWEWYIPGIDIDNFQLNLKIIYFM